MSSITAEIELNIDRDDWDADCHEECRRLLHGAHHRRVASAGVHRPNLGKEEGRKRAGILDPAAGRAAQAEMRAATADPLRNLQLERIVKLALGKRVPIAPTATGGGDPSQATTPAVEPAGNQHAERRVESEEESESHALDPTRPGGSPPAMGKARPAASELRGLAAQSSSGTPAAQPSGTAPPAKAVATTQEGKKKNRAARRAARAAWESKEGSPTAGDGQLPSVVGLPRGREAVSGVWLHEGARPERLPNVLGHDAERKAIVPALPATSFEHRM